MFILIKIHTIMQSIEPGEMCALNYDRFRGTLKQTL